jgi:SAM-dependent methyltransferase
VSVIARLRASYRYRVDHSWLRGDLETMWCRAALNDAVDAYLDRLDVGHLDAVEISGSRYAGRGWRSYTQLTYPDFDVCAELPRGHDCYDVVICEQVLEHVPDPWRGMQTVTALLRPGGRAIVSTPFLVRVHPQPGDYWRFTPDGLRLLAERSGLSVEAVDSWGNRVCARRNFNTWMRRLPWHPMRNERDVALNVWMFATKDDQAALERRPA